MINHVEACFPTPTVDYIPAMAGQEDYIRWVEARSPEFARSRHLPYTGSFEADDVMAFHRSPENIRASVAPAPCKQDNQRIDLATLPEKWSKA